MYRLKAKPRKDIAKALGVTGKEIEAAEKACDWAIYIVPVDSKNGDKFQGVFLLNINGKSVGIPMDNFKKIGKRKE